MHRSIILILLASILCCGQASFAEVLSAHYLSAVDDSLMDLELNYDEQIPVKGLAITRGGAMINLTDGYITFSQSIMGLHVGAAFTGHGSLTLVPKSGIAQYALREHAGDSVVTWSFEEAFFLFTDGTDSELVKSAIVGRLKKSNHEDSRFREFCRDLDHDFEFDTGLLLLCGLIDPVNNGVFLMRFRDASRAKMLFRHSLSAAEDVALFRRSNLGAGDKSWLVCSYSSDTLVATRAISDRQVEKPNYHLNVDIPDQHGITVVTDVSCVVQTDSLKWLTFLTPSDCGKTSLTVLDANGQELYWQKADAFSALMVFLGRAFRKGEHVTVSFSSTSRETLRWLKMYHGAVVNRFWYPILTCSEPATYEAEFRYPREYRVIAMGEETTDSVDSEWRYAKWTTEDRKLFRMTFDIAQYQCDSTYPTPGSVVVSYFPENEGEDDRGSRQRFLSDVGAAVALFDSILAPFPFQRLRVASCPTWEPEVYPGYIKLPNLALRYFRFLSTEAIGAGVESTIGSAVASQWLDYMVKPATSRDFWLRLGLSQYLGAYFSEAKHQSDSVRNLYYHQIVGDWKRSLLRHSSRDYFGLPKDSSAARSFIGAALPDSAAAEPRASISPEKGAYLLHMLRFLMRDVASRNDSAFAKMLAEFVAAHAFSPVTTSDFKAMAEAHYGSDLTWFFNEYVYGTTIPHFKWQVVCDTTTAPPVVTVLVDTEQAPPDYRMPIPFAVLMGDGSVAYINLQMDEPTKQFRFTVPARPTDYVFNPRNAVLCEDERIR